MDLPRHSLNISIDEHRARVLAESLCQFRRKLVTGNDLCALADELLSKQPPGVPAETVITAQRVSVAYDEGPVRLPHRLLTSSSTAPCGPSNWICMGIWPAAWVEQLKQGS